MIKYLLLLLLSPLILHAQDVTIEILPPGSTLPVDSTEIYIGMISDAIDDEPNNGELFYMRGMLTFYRSWPTHESACNDFRTAKRLGFSNSEMKNLMTQSCWKHDNVWIQEEGLHDSTIIDSVLEILPDGWNVYSISDQNTYMEAEQESDRFIKYNMVLINEKLNFIDTVWSTTSELSPEITVVVTNKTQYKQLNKKLKESERNLESGQVMATEIIKSKNELLIFRWSSEDQLSRTENERVRERYYSDKKEIIAKFKTFDW